MPVALPDQLDVCVPVGGRVLVVSDLLLGSEATPASLSATEELSHSLDAWDGAGVLVVAGNLLDLAASEPRSPLDPDGPRGSESRGADESRGAGRPGPVRRALEAHGRLGTSLARFREMAGRRVVVVPGDRDSVLASDPAHAAELRDVLGAELAGAVELALETGAGPRRVRVEAGEDPAGDHRAGRTGQGTNDASRAAARARVTAGYAGLISGGTRRPELSRLGPGFFACPGALGEVTEERRLGPGLPPVRVYRRLASWVEVEAGADLHVRLLRGVTLLPGASLLQRLVARDERRGAGRPAVVGSFPHGPEWPGASDPGIRLRRVRRWAAVGIAGGGVVDLLSAVTPPFHSRLEFLQDWVPLSVSRAANAVVALAGLALLFLARGVRRGQHRAWLVSVAVLGLTSFLHLVKGIDVEETAVSLAVLAFLLVNRGSFSASADRPSLRRAVATVATGGLLAVAVAVAAVELTLAVGAHTRALPFSRAVEAVGGRLVAVHLVPLPRRLDLFVTPALTAVTFGVVTAALYLACRPVVTRHAAPADELGRARAAVGRWGKGTLDYFALRSDKSFFFSGETMVAYGVYGGVCLVSPDPVGPESERADAWSRFRAFAYSQGWSLAVMGAGEEWLPVYRDSGMHDMYVGDEAVVDVTRLDLSGGRHKGLRQAVNRIAKYGYRVSFHDPRLLDAEQRRAVESVMEKSRRGEVERGFSMTLGRLFDNDDRDLLMAVAWDPDGEPVAFCQYVPAPGIHGYSLDLMRRDAGEHPNGLIDFLVVETARHLRERGMRCLGLNFATMRAVVSGESGDSLTQRVERWMLRRLSGSMQIESLWRFNAKFDPEWLPRYLVYDAPEHLLPVGAAVARAESFWELPLIGRFLVPS